MHFICYRKEFLCFFTGLSGYPKYGYPKYTEPTTKILVGGDEGMFPIE
jgi:hypothetical protein